LAEHPLGGLDALTVLAAVAQRAARIELGTAIVPTWPRHPMVLAAQALTTNQLTGGRLTLGIGLSHGVMLEQGLGISMTRPIGHLREFLSILMPLLTTGEVAFSGERLACRAHLFKAPSEPLPVLVAALGPQALRVAGRFTDGTVLAWVGPRTIREHIVPTLTQSAEQAGRRPPRVVATLPVCVSSEPRAVHERARKSFAMYGDLPSYRAMFEREGVDGPADLLIAGDESAVGKRITQLAEAGVTDFAASEFTRTEDESRRTRELLRSLL
jgi:F420-dependent oxidoreductase-like protein